GTDCSEDYVHGTTVTLTATPATGSSFAGWSGACSGAGTCTVSMTAARTVTATFNAANYGLTVSRSGSGSGMVTSNPTGVTCGTDCTESYAYGTTVSLTATPAAGASFTGWSGACTGTGNCVVGMTSSRTVTAHF
ncbi:MAG: InlB B-repeat-containing protein, partial [Burkholderiales bacterium]